MLRKRRMASHIVRIAVAIAFVMGMCRADCLAGHTFKNTPIKTTPGSCCYGFKDARVGTWAINPFSDSPNNHKPVIRLDPNVVLPVLCDTVGISYYDSDKSVWVSINEYARIPITVHNEAIHYTFVDSRSAGHLMMIRNRISRIDVSCRSTASQDTPVLSCLNVYVAVNSVSIVGAAENTMMKMANIQDTVSGCIQIIEEEGACGPEIGFGPLVSPLSTPVPIVTTTSTTPASTEKTLTVFELGAVFDDLTLSAQLTWCPECTTPDTDSPASVGLNAGQLGVCTASLRRTRFNNQKGTVETVSTHTLSFTDKFVLPSLARRYTITSPSDETATTTVTGPLWALWHVVWSDEAHSIVCVFRVPQSGSSMLTMTARSCELLDNREDTQADALSLSVSEVRTIDNDDSPIVVCDPNSQETEPSAEARVEPMAHEDLTYRFIVID